MNPTLAPGASKENVAVEPLAKQWFLVSFSAVVKCIPKLFPTLQKGPYKVSFDVELTLTA